MPVLFPIEAVIPAILFAGLMIGTPGPTNMILLSMGARFGIRRSMSFILGVNGGFLVVLTMVALGMDALFTRFPSVRLAFVVLSGLYLLYLAWKIANAKLPVKGAEPMDGAARGGFLQGVVAHVLNPKTWATVTTATTQFTDPLAAPLMVQSMILGAIFVCMGVPINIVWTWAGDRIIGAISDDRTRLTVNWTLAFLTLAIVIYMMIAQFRMPV